jgi:hypothetical protein
MRSPVAELLGALGAVLDWLGVGWYLFGAQAALLYGAARLTADVDVTVDLGSRAPSELVAVLTDAGFAVRRRDDFDDFIARTRVVPLVHVPSGVPVDIVLAGPGPEQLFLERARRHVVEGVPVPVASPEDMVAMKVLAGRAKDLDDALAILVANPALDAALVRGTLGPLEAVLDRSDLVPAFEDLLRRSRQPT